MIAQCRPQTVVYVIHRRQNGDGHLTTYETSNMKTLVTSATEGEIEDPSDPLPCNLSELYRELQ